MADLTKERLADVFRLPRASRYAAPENGGDPLPVVYGDLTVPARSASGVYVLPKIDTAGAGTYCVAGTEILGSVSLFDDDGPIPPEDYALDLANNLQGKGIIATAAFSVAPSGIVTGVCKGRKDASGALIENPVRMAEDLMRALWGFDAQDLDAQALGRAVEAAEAQGYAAAGVIEDDHAPADVLTELLGNFLGRFEVDPHGRLRVWLAGEEMGALFPGKALPSFEAAEVAAEVSLDAIINQVPVLFARNYAEGRNILHDGGEAAADAASRALYGVRTPPEGRLILNWVRDPAVAATVQARIVERFREPARFFIIRDGTFRALEVEADDYVAFSVPWIPTEELEPLANQIGQVVSVSPDLRDQTVELRIRDTGFFLTTASPADGSGTAGGGVLAGGRRDFAVYA